MRYGLDTDQRFVLPPSCDWRLYGEPGWNRTLDLAIRWVLALGLGGWAVAGLAGLSALPLFISLKLVAFVGCILLGLYIRSVLKPLGPALMGLSGPDASAAAASLAQTLNQARPLVAGIWALLIIAAFLGLWTPTTF